MKCTPSLSLIFIEIHKKYFLLQVRLMAHAQWILPTGKITVSLCSQNEVWSLTILQKCQLHVCSQTVICITSADTTPENQTQTKNQCKIENTSHDCCTATSKGQQSLWIFPCHAFPPSAFFLLTEESVRGGYASHTWYQVTQWAPLRPAAPETLHVVAKTI